MQIIFTDGLGNQMFQYALYLAMKAQGLKPSINISIINRNIVHNGFELCDDFMIERNSLNIVDGGWFGGGATIFITRYIDALCYKESNNYDFRVFETYKPFIYGYWQDERYFFNIVDEVRQAFEFRNIDDINRKLDYEMRTCNSVSLHIRRGDYLKYPNLMICTPSYYKRAIALIKEKINDPIFYVFSDDLIWSDKFLAEQNVNYKIINHNRGRDSYKDMYLMTCCRHNIIANSSFSWWGAWLGNNTEKIVVRPDEWIKNSPKNPCPKHWLRT